MRNAGDGRYFARARNEAVCGACIGSGHSHIGRAKASPCQGIRLSQEALSCHRVATADASASPTSVDEQDRCISEKVARALCVGGNARERKAVVITVSLRGSRHRFMERPSRCLRSHGPQLRPRQCLVPVANAGLLVSLSPPELVGCLRVAAISAPNRKTTAEKNNHIMRTAREPAAPNEFAVPAWAR